MTCVAQLFSVLGLLGSLDDTLSENCFSNLKSYFVTFIEISSWIFISFLLNFGDRSFVHVINVILTQICENFRLRYQKLSIVRRLSDFT